MDIPIAAETAVARLTPPGESVLDPAMEITPWDEAAKAGRYADAVAAYVAANDWATYPTLARMLAPYMAVTGSYGVHAPEDPNIVMWMGASSAFLTVINEALRDGRIYAWPVSAAALIADGAVLRYPVAVRRPEGGYRSRHWKPIAFRGERF